MNTQNNTYDSIIIGAGVAGATIAYKLTQKKQKVLVIDKEGIAKGGSGSAGAFVSPKIGVGSSLQSLTNEAFEFSKDFYLDTCPQFFHQTGVLRIAKDEKDSEKFPLYEKVNQNKYLKYTQEELKALGIDSHLNNFYFPEAGDCDAVEVCDFLLKNIEVVREEVTEVKKENNLWCIGKYRAKNIILATGYENTIMDVDYMHIRGTWGTRGDYFSSLKLGMSVHQSLSIGANNKGIIKIGATHQHQIKTKQPCEAQEMEPLQEKASLLMKSRDFKLKKLYCGMRAGSKDYAPLVGKVIDVEYMLKAHPKLIKGEKHPFHYIDNLYMFNGLGGRGFVFAPFLAQMLSEVMIEDKEIDKRVNPDRLFFKWCRKLI